MTDAAKHPLENKWTIWYDSKKTIVDETNWEKNLQKVCSTTHVICFIYNSPRASYPMDGVFFIRLSQYFSLVDFTRHAAFKNALFFVGEPFV